MNNVDKICTVMIGVPGSGKTHYAEKLADQSSVEVEILCSNDYFEDEQGNFRYHAGELQEAHDDCFRNAMDAFKDGIPHVIIDNTNSSMHEVAPYARLAEIHGYDLQFVYCRCSLRTALNRNIHQVPETTVSQMHVRTQMMVEKGFPKRWSNKIKVINTDD